MKILLEKIVNTNDYAGRVDIITGIEDFKDETEYNEEWHTYRVDGKIVPSVTQILDDDSYANVDVDILEYARFKGTLVHKEIEEWLRDGKTGFTDELQEFIRLFNENKPLFEQKAIFDIKTSTVLNKSKTRQQCTMYAGGIKHLANEDITKYYAIHLPHNKKGKIIDLEVE
jgi:hypothetical protein